MVGRRRRHGGGCVQRRRVRGRHPVPEPVRRTAGRLRRVPGDGDVLADRIPSQTGWALVLPTNSNGNYEQQDSGIFYPYLPDLPIARIIFLAGILAACLGLLGLPAHAGGRWLRRTAAVITLAGVAATGTAVGLASTARLTPQGMAIAALHDAANDRPIVYTPVCGVATQTPVCLNPAYQRYLTDVTAALAPVLDEVAGLPGAPERAIQVAAAYVTGDDGAPPSMTISGTPPILRIPLGAESSPCPAATASRTPSRPRRSSSTSCARSSRRRSWEPPRPLTTTTRSRP